MKKIIPYIILLIVVASVIFCLFRGRKSSSGDKFGFLRNFLDLNQENIQDTGAKWFRPNFGYFVWGVMQKSENASIDFSDTDKIVYETQKRGLHLLVTLFPYADWDQEGYGGKCRVSENDEMLPRKKGSQVTEGLPYYRCNPKNWTLYEKWLTALVERYDGDGKDDMEGLKYPILYYEIVNEPDLTKDPKSDYGTVFYLGTPEDYAQLLQKSYKTIKLAGSGVNVLIAGAAGVQSSFQEYWKRVFSVPQIANYFDIANIHCISSPNVDSSNPVAISANDLNVASYKKLLSNYGIDKPIWVTEAENIQGDDIDENVKRLKESVIKALNDGAEKIFFTGTSFADDSMKYTSEILIKERKYYKEIISEIK